MRWLLLALSAAVVVLPVVPLAAGGPSAEQLFEARCASCHTLPDPGLRTDLAWLDQVNRTT